MKNSLNILVAVLLVVGVSLLSACGSSGGSGSGGAAGGPANGYQAGSNAQGYVGQGTWRGSMTINNPGVWSQYLQSTGCQGQICSATDYISLTISTLQGQCPGSNTGDQFGGQYANSGVSGGGNLPGPIQFVLQPFSNGRAFGQQTNQCGSGFLNQSNNGFLINYDNVNGGFNGNSFNGGGNFYVGNNGYQNGYQNNVNPGTPTLQIITVWTDNSHTVLNVQINYLGTPFATGQVTNTGGFQNVNGQQWGAFGAGGGLQYQQQGFVGGPVYSQVPVRYYYTR